MLIDHCTALEHKTITSVRVLNSSSSISPPTMSLPKAMGMIEIGNKSFLMGILSCFCGCGLLEPKSVGLLAVGAALALWAALVSCMWAFGPENRSFVALRDR